MTKQEVIEQLCELASEVGNHLGNRFAHDCFCEHSLQGSFQFEKPVMDFIKQAVREKIECT